MKLAKSELARVILNDDAVEDFINHQVNAHPKLKAWIEKTLKRWILQKAPAEKSVLQEIKGLPNWATKEDTVNVNIEETSTLVLPVLDYLEAQLAERPTFNLGKVGVDQAIVASKKWHDALAKRKQKITLEPGVTKVMEFPNGYFWALITSGVGLQREGNLMGHCVGGEYYHTRTLTGEYKIYSLRDSSNVPHITLDMTGDRVNQIKGKTNADILPEYLPYLFEFLKKMNPKTILFDGGRALEKEYIEWKRETAKEYLGYKCYLVPSTTGGVAVSADGGEWTVIQNSTVYEKNTPEARAAAAFLISEKMVNKEKVDYGFSQLIADYWYEYGGNTVVANYFFHVDDPIMCKKHGIVFAFCGRDLEINPKVAPKSRQSVVASLPIKTGKHAGYYAGITVTVDDKKDEGLTKWANLSHLKSEVDDAKNDESTLDKVLAALNQPSLEEIKKTVDFKPSEEMYSQYGIPLGGTSVHALALVIALCLNKHKQQAKEFLLSRPNAKRNWESFIKGEYPLAFQRLGVDDTTNPAFTSYISNLYKRLE